MLASQDVDFEKFFSAARLRRTWRTLRREFSSILVRDALDHLDWVASLDKSLIALSRDIIAGTYETETPTRYEAAKSRGAFRVMTGLAPPDALVYRHLADHIYEKALPQKIPGAFFSRRHKATPVGKTFTYEVDDYDAFFSVWLRYSEYKTRTLLRGVYRILVTTDISNYFDSIQHDLLLEYIAPLQLPRKAVALLARLLEQLKPATGHSPTPRVGLPVDEIDGSRQIAHAFLFEHDQRVVRQVGEDHYVRWMDDQNIGVRNATEARRVINSLTRSLAEQRLTLNTGKTRFLKLADIPAEFHLETNERLTVFEERRRAGGPSSLEDLDSMWSNACTLERKGHWVKVLKRFYGEFGALRSDRLEDRALQDLVEYPEIDERIFRYYSVRGRARSLVRLFREYVERRECLYEATEAAFFDACTACRGVVKEDELEFRAIARDYLEGKLRPTSGRPAGKVGALLLLYWVDAIGNVVKWNAEILRGLPAEVVRAWLAVMAATQDDSTAHLIARAAAHGGSQVARLGVFLNGLENGEMEIKYPFVYPKTHYPWRDVKYYDVRAWLSLELLARFPAEPARVAARALVQFEKLASGRGEARIVARVRRTLAAGT